MLLSHLPRTLMPVATQICHLVGHSDVTSVHCIMPLGATHRPCAIAPPTSPSARPFESSLTGCLNPSIRGVWNTPACFPGYNAHYCMQQSAHWVEKVRIAICALRTRLARVARTACPLPVVGSTPSVVGKLC